MSILSCASNASTWRGYEYYESKKVTSWKKINDEEYEREEEEQAQKFYDNIVKYVNSLSEEELRIALINALTEDYEIDDYW